MIRRALVTAAVAVAVTATATPANAAHGWVANSCAVQQALHAKVGEEYVNGMRQDRYAFIPCGSGLGGIMWVNAGPRPYFVNPEPRPDGYNPPPFCMQAGQRYVPNSYGAVLTPTVRCR